MLLLPLHGGLFHLLIQLLDGFSQRSHLLDEASHLLLGLLNGFPQVAHVQIKLSHLFLRVGQLLLAVGPPLLILDLLPSQQCHHLVNHLDDLVEARSPRPQRGADSLQPRALPATERLQRALLHTGQLHKGGRGQGPLEEVQRFIVVEQLDGRGDGLELLGSKPLVHRPVRFLLATALLEVREERAVLSQSFGGVVEVALRVRAVHRDLARARRLGLDLLREGPDLPSLGNGNGFRLNDRSVEGLLH
mmetsp:Transcript_49665/g.115146  ORF Transcript_49665/g.115146 Transcript_49665/m.115146 type:complete len:247 (+) Transcript_49665:666-1406(+)